MTDRELLEAAAKAAKIGGGWEYPATSVNTPFWRDGRGSAWAPLTVDRDAFRLAICLEMVVQVRRNVSRVKLAGVQEGFGQSHNGDPYAATRRAIVRAAAGIGSAS